MSLPVINIDAGQIIVGALLGLCSVQLHQILGRLKQVERRVADLELFLAGRGYRQHYGPD